MKPAAGSQGNNIRILIGRAACVEWWARFTSLETDPEALRWVLQCYVANPLTLYPERRKFDLRLYLLAVKAPRAPISSYIFVDGLVRICTGSYSPPTPHDLAREEWRYAHLTNTSLNGSDTLREHPNTKGCTELLRSSTTLQEALRSIGSDIETVWASLIGKGKMDLLFSRFLNHQDRPDTGISKSVAPLTLFVCLSVEMARRAMTTLKR